MVTLYLITLFSTVEQFVSPASQGVSNAGAWSILRKVHNDPEYNEILEECLAEGKRLSGRAIDQDKKSREAMIFLTSPDRVTAYHIDRGCDCLVQVNGEKQISIFDRRQGGSAGAGTGEFLVKGQSCRSLQALISGLVVGIHHAAGYRRAYSGHCPHWRKNGNNVSISLRISYQYQDRRRKNAYQANYYLRKLG